MGEIAISKLLSPSHAAHSVSLYSEFKEWLKESGIEQSGFQGFTANRFGRIAEISKLFLKMRKVVLEFFDQVVDVSSNRLVLAVSVYIQSPWFHMCCCIYERIGNLVIFPMMEMLGIDDKGRDLKSERNWKGMKEFLGSKMGEMMKISDALKTATQVIDFTLQS